MIECVFLVVDLEYILVIDYIFVFVIDDWNMLNKIGECIINVEFVFVDVLWFVGKVSYL